MKLATYSETADSARKTGIVAGDALIDTGFPGTMIELISQWESWKDRLRELAASGAGRPLSSVRLHAPVERPGKIWAIGLNYADHIAESKMETPSRQIWFTKAQTSINGPCDPILITRSTLRPFLAEAVTSVIPNAIVLSYQETAPAKKVETSSQVTVPA